MRKPSATKLLANVFKRYAPERGSNDESEHSDEYYESDQGVEQDLCCAQYIGDLLLGEGGEHDVEPEVQQRQPTPRLDDDARCGCDTVVGR